MQLRHRTSCRVCGSAALTNVIDLGDQYLQGAFIGKDGSVPVNRKIPTKLVHCDPSRDENACGLLQMVHSVPPAILYSSYWYRSGTNQTMRQHLKSVVSEALETIGTSTVPLTVLDIGCNDGTLLRNYPDSFHRFGVDPSDIAREIGDGITVVSDTFPSAHLKNVGKGFDIITSIAMFYDLESPVDFVSAIRSVLAPDGLWVFEMSYMPKMLELNSYDTICHEHLEYYSLAVIEEILARAGMKLVKVSFNDINGGSIRCIATDRGSNRFTSICDDLMAIRIAEFEMELDSNEPYFAFQRRIEEQRDELRNFILGLKAEGKRIHVYGASTKGNTILQWCGLDFTAIECAADRNPEKHGARTLGTDIPIVSEEQSRSMKPDYYLVLPWHFRAEFLERERETIARGTGMIFPLPKIDVVRPTR